MAFNVCIIDDDFPTKDATVIEFDFKDDSMLNSTEIKLMSSKVENWNDVNLKSLVRALSGDDTHWNLFAFKAPEFFINHIENDIIALDVIVFDYDYPGARDQENSIENLLFEILNNTYCLIYIFSGAEKQHEIEEMMQKEKFAVFCGRLSYLSKTTVNSVETLVGQINERKDNNFSFKFGNKLTKDAFDSINKILVELGKVTTNQTVNYFKITNDTKRDLIDFIGERYKNHMADFQFEELNNIEQNYEGEVNEELAKDLWSYRLYHYSSNNNDNIVRKGDIIEKEENLYLVISADCELAYFWKKNYGHINMVPLYKMYNGNDELKKKLTNTKSPGDIKNSFTQNSITNKINGISDGPLIFPFIKRQDQRNNYLCFPKELVSVKVDEPELSKKDLGNEPLKYSTFRGYNKICSVSEPFLTPIITHLLNSIFGYGSPDYPVIIKNIIKNDSKTLFE